MRILAGVLVAAFVLSGGFVALAGMGYISSHGHTSQTWAMAGSLLVGLGVALAITVFRRPR